MTGVVAIGEPLAVFTALHTGPVRAGDQFRVGLGGAECNVAVGCRRLGVPAAVVGVVGDDPLGSALLRTLRSDDVDVSGLTVDGSAFTAVMVKEMRTAGQVRISYLRSGSAGSRLAPTHLDGADVEGAAVVHSTGVTASFGDEARACLREAAVRVHAAGGLVSFDVNFRSRLWPDPAVAAKVLLGHVADADVVFLGESEAAVLGLGGSPADVLAAVAALGPTQVVYKRPGSVDVLDHGEAHQLDVAAVPALDPVGAGDAFAAGYLARLLQGEPLTVRLETAAALGLWSVTTHGDNDGLPYADELAAYAQDNVLR